MKRIKSNEKEVRNLSLECNTGACLLFLSYVLNGKFWDHFSLVSYDADYQKRQYGNICCCSVSGAWYLRCLTPKLLSSPALNLFSPVQCIRGRKKPVVPVQLPLPVQFIRNPGCKRTPIPYYFLKLHRKCVLQLIYQPCIGRAEDKRSPSSWS